jgi:inner membrane protease subunit 2
MNYIRPAFLLGVPLYFIHLNLFSVAAVIGNSMQPVLNPESNLNKSDIVLLKKTTEFKSGDVVMMKHPTKQIDLVKRIIGVHGDIIVPREGRHDVPSKDPVFISEGSCWVQGDEPFIGIDSNHFGQIPLGLVKYKVIGILYPFSRFTVKI